LALPGFICLLKAYQIDMLADVRTIPRSRHNPQFNKETLPAELALYDIRYRHLPGLGGLRKTILDSINRGWRNASFRGFADYMQSPQFREALKRLLSLAKTCRVAIMCAEAVPWRCHRSLIADALTVRGLEVQHIMSLKSAHRHKLTPWLKAKGTKIWYPLDKSNST
jgi:uncharacterized protein (DUF488 family)